MEARGLDRLAAEIVRRIRSVSDPELIIIFGSYARGDIGPDSDVDVLVVVGSMTHQRDEIATLRQALRGLGLPVDVVLTTSEQLEQYGSSPYTIFETALREGIVIYEREAA